MYFNSRKNIFIICFLQSEVIFLINLQFTKIVILNLNKNYFTRTQLTIKCLECSDGSRILVSECRTVIDAP